MDEEVKTVFSVADQANGPMAQMEKGSKNLSESAEKAQKEIRKLGLAQIEAAKMNAEYDKSKAGGAAAPVSRAMAAREERKGNEQFAVDKEEMLARRARTRHVKLEMQKEQLLHRAAESAMMMMVGEENKYAKQVSKYGAGAQMIGAQMAGVGGAVGAVGGVLAKLGGYASLAGVGIEALAAIDEWTGGHIEHAGEAALNWAQHMMGVSDTTMDLQEKAELQAKYLGYKNVADYKAGKAAIRAAELQDASNYSFQRFTQELDRVGDKMPDTAKGIAEMVEKMATSVAGTGSEMQMEEARKGAAAALSASAMAITSHAEHEAKLADVEREAIKHIEALPHNASLEQQQAHIAAIRSEITSIIAHDKSLLADSGALATALIARSQEEGTIQSMIAQRVASAAEEEKMALLIRASAAQLPKKFDKMGHVTDAYNAALANIIPQIARDSSLVPEQTKKLLEGIDMAKSKAPNFDFRHSRFDIKQNFAEKFDPDRIAVAFTSDLVQLGERRLQSGLSPVFGATR